jgi:hypothetical protein
MLNDAKTALPVAAAAYLGTRLAAGFTKGKSAVWEVAGGIAGALAGIVLVKQMKIG